MKCAYSTGICVNYGNYDISMNIKTPISNSTGLAATLSSADFGYRITYEDTNGVVRQIHYAQSNTTNITWADGIPVSTAVASSSWGLASYCTIDGNQTVYSIETDGSNHLVPGYSQVDGSGNWTKGMLVLLLAAAQRLTMARS